MRALARNYPLMSARLKAKLQEFFLTPYTPKPLAIFRILLSMVLLWQATWFAVMMPEYATFNNSWLAHFPVVCLVAGWGTLLVEIGYPFFIWPRKTRLIWVGAT